jgi:ribosomal protein S18 acetylase RimI-like enzyme
MAALSDPKLPEVVELSQLDVSEFDALFGEEIAVWDEKFHWDFRPSAELLRRFLLVHSLIGYALRVGQSVVGYTYCVCEGRKGLIGDLYLKHEFGGAENEALLLGSAVQGLMRTAGIKRIESQLMLLRHRTGQLPFAQYLSRHDRLFMSIDSRAAAGLKQLSAASGTTFHSWAERYQEETAHLVAAAYRGHVDSEINDQYRTIPGARHFLTNIIRYPGCGVFSPDASLVAYDAHTGKISGACLASRVSHHSGHITQLCVLPAIRGSHLGYELLRRALARLQAMGCTTVSLTVTASNQKAIDLYESVGFKRTAVFPALIWDDF